MVPTFALKSLQIVPNGYGEGDTSYGIPVPLLRKIAKEEEEPILLFHSSKTRFGRSDSLKYLEENLFRYRGCPPYQKKPEPILLEKEYRREVFDSLDGCAPREKTFLAYRFGYPADDERTKKETREHFGLSETRAEDLEQQSCTHFKENYIELQRKTEESLKQEEPQHVPSCVAPRTGADRGMIIRWI